MEARTLYLYQWRSEAGTREGTFFTEETHRLPCYFAKVNVSRRLIVSTAYLLELNLR